MPDCSHTRKRSVLGKLGGDGSPIYGVPPENDNEPAWCSICGALWCQTGFGWGWLAPLRDHGAPTLLNLLCKEERK